MKKLLFAIPVLALAVAGCVKDEPYVNPNPGPEPTPPGPTPTVTANIVFNELDCGNKKIELYNTGDAEVDMTGWIMSKDDTEWEIPSGRGKIAAKGYAVFTGKSDGSTDPTFGLSGTKGFLLVLKDKDGKVIDQVNNTSEREGGIVTIEDGKSWGRKTDGASEWVIFDVPTIGAANGGGAAPAPAGRLCFNECDTQNKKIELYNGTNSEIDMTGWIMSKDETEWEIPAERGKIAAKGYAVFTGKSDGTTDPTFGLSGTKGFLLVLKDKDGNVIDEVDNTSNREGGIVTIEDGKSWGRKTDGADEWVIFDTPTIGSANHQ